MPSPRGQKFGFLMVLFTLATLAAVIALTLAWVEAAMTAQHRVNLEASPHGYTVSLSLVVIPFLLLLWWYVRYDNEHRAQWPALLWTILFITVVWVLLDVLFAPSIFQFPNCKATVECYLPGWLPGHGFSGAFPVEEVLFYLFACFFMLLLYVAASEIWFPEGSIAPADYEARARAAVPIATTRLRELRWWPFAAGVVLILLGILYKYLWADPPLLPPAQIPAQCDVNVCIPGHTLPQPLAHQGTGFPIYFTLLVLIVILPVLVLYDKLVLFVNVRALQFTVFVVVLISVIWEVTLALPYGWWGYQHHWMVGIRVRAWFDLPIESVILWVAAGFGITFTYEFLRLMHATGLTLAQALWRGAPTGNGS